MFFTKGDGIGLERSLILPCQRVLEFGGEVQDIEGTFRVGPGTAILLYGDILLDVPLLRENERSTSLEATDERRTGTELSEDMLGGGRGDRRGASGPSLGFKYRDVEADNPRDPQPAAVPYSCPSGNGVGHQTK